MTTALVHGDPGSFKTSSLVNDYLVPAIKAGRVVVTNIRGVKSPQEIAEVFNFPLPDTAEIILMSFDQEGFDLMARFFHWAPLGALILMDEGQRVYPTRLKSFHEFDNPNDDGRPKTVEDAFDSHRHMNWDIYISTPNISKIHKEIRAVAEFAYRHKNLATVFSFLNGRYKRVVHNAENSGASLSHAISSTLRKMDKRVFDVYQSTATGKTKDSSSSVSLFKQPKFLLLVCIVAYSVWNMGSLLLHSGGVPALLGGSAKTPVAQSANPPAKVPAASSANVPAGDVRVRPSDSNPFLNATIFSVGDFNNASQFMVQLSEDNFFVVTQSDLENLGFVVTRLNSNIFKLAFGQASFYVFPRPRPAVEQASVDLSKSPIVN